MAAPMVGFLSTSFKHLSIFQRSPVLSSYTPLLELCRGKKSKTRGSVRTQQRRTPGKFREPKRLDGHFVYKGEVLVKQLRLMHYPGENVGVQKNNTLYAERDGIVMVTCEQLNPYPDSPLYNRVKNGVVIHKKFWNVYPTPVNAAFKLVSQT